MTSGIFTKVCFALTIAIFGLPALRAEALPLIGSFSEGASTNDGNAGASAGQFDLNAFNSGVSTEAVSGSSSIANDFGLAGNTFGAYNFDKLTGQVQGGDAFATVTDTSGFVSGLDAVTGTVQFNPFSGPTGSSNYEAYAFLIQGGSILQSQATGLLGSTGSTTPFDFVLPSAGTYTLGFAVISDGATNPVGHAGAVTTTSSSVGAPEIDSSSSAVPLALVCGVFLVLLDRKRSA